MVQQLFIVAKNDKIKWIGTPLIMGDWDFLSSKSGKEKEKKELANQAHELIIVFKTWAGGRGPLLNSALEGSEVK